MSLYSFVAKKLDDPPSLSILRSSPTDADTSAVEFKIVKGSLTANNKFYWSFGERPPFNFFKCYPVDPQTSALVVQGDDDNLSDYAHPPVWGVAEVTCSKVDGVQVGDRFLAMLPIGQSVSFDKASVDPIDGSKLIVERPDTFAAYNTFTKIDPDDAMASPKFGDLAVASFPGIITGFGLYYRLLHCNCYGGVQRIVITSASSKVGLALAIFIKKSNEATFANTQIIGYTSKNNMTFCESTKVFDEVLNYEDLLGSNDDDEQGVKDYVMIDISGRGDIYSRNVEENPTARIAKLLVIGNASSTADDQSTVAHFSLYAKVKMIMSFVGVPKFLRSWMQPTQEFYLIVDDLAELTTNWGLEKLNEKKKAFGKIF
ncbi:MAG: hypothetical protein SGARI_002652, partial [Bacillariaceae sp.]